MLETEYVCPSFIPAELAEAPSHPLRKSPFKLRNISVAQHNRFSVWFPQIDSTLLAEEAELLKSERKRVEAICSNAADSSYWNGVHTRNWQTSLSYASKHSFTPDAGVIDVAYFYEMICPLIGEVD